MRERAILLAITAAIAVIVAGCFGDAAVGPCTLRVGILHGGGGGGGDFLEPPYRVGLPPDTLTFSGLGWSQMNIELRSETGQVENYQLDRQQARNRGASIPFDRPGQWQVRISDPMSGCRREFAVEVVPSIEPAKRERAALDDLEASRTAGRWPDLVRPRQRCCGDPAGRDPPGAPLAPGRQARRGLCVPGLRHLPDGRRVDCPTS